MIGNEGPLVDKDPGRLSKPKVMRKRESQEKSATASAPSSPPPPPSCVPLDPNRKRGQASKDCSLVYLLLSEYNPEEVAEDKEEWAYEAAQEHLG